MTDYKILADLRHAAVLSVSPAQDKKEMNRRRIYWVCQLTGWFLYILINNAVISSFEGFSWKRALVWLFFGALGVTFTHIYRSVIKKQNWLELPLKTTIVRVLLASLIMGAAIFILVFGLNILTGLYDFERFRPIVTPLTGIMNVGSIILIWSLLYFSVHYFENYKRAEIESYIWEAAVKDFELKTLKSQLNPHFMFNAMNSIRALIEEDPASAQTALTKLSNILRYSLKIERNETVPLEEEMMTVSDYLALERIRFEERLKYDINVGAGSAKIEIPPMMIQTLVENGIKHGISKRTEGGSVSVSSDIKDNLLHIIIKNSGRIEDDAVKNSKGFGINNTKHRLNLLYGEKASFVIRNNSEDNVIAEIIIPTGGINR